MKFRRETTNQTRKASAPPFVGLENLESEDKFAAGVARRNISELGWGYLKRSGQMAIEAWVRLQRWLDSELIATPDPSAKKPFKLEAIELEDRILYSASPLLAVMGSGDSLENPALDSAELSIALDEIVANLLAATSAELSESAELAGPVVALFEHSGPGKEAATPLDTELLGQADVDEAVGDTGDRVEADARGTSSGMEVVFVQAGLLDSESMVAEIVSHAEATGRSVSIVMMDGANDGFEQIDSILSQYKDLDAIHIVSHGTDGMIQLGGSWLTASNVQDRAFELQRWGMSLTETGDILIYGCDVAATSVGQVMIDQIATFSEADVAASWNKTGDANQGGDWNLEYSTGWIAASDPFGVTFQDSYQGLLAIYTVGNTNDSGAGSLRQAIIDANNNAGTDTVQFSVGSGVISINLSSALPTITGTIIIDGWTQPGYSATPIVVIDGSEVVGDGFVLTSTADNSTIRGLVIRDFNGDGIQIDSGSDGNTIVGNYIGSFASSGGSLGSGEANTGNGINVLGASNTIGGTTAQSRNVIGGNLTNGILLTGTGANNNIVQGNYIGTDATGTGNVGNSGDGVRIANSSNANTIGGTTTAHRNIIVANGSDGIEITGASSHNNVIRNNFIGLGADGFTVLGNAVDGILIDNGPDNTIIGGINMGNVILGNRGNAIEIDGTSTLTVVQGNFIGINLAGTIVQGAGLSGILVEGGATSTMIGGTTTGEGNIITDSGLLSATNNAGVQVLGGSASGTTIIGNSIYNNRGIGIDLGTTGVTANDTGDGDTGPNGLQNFPILTAASVNAAGTTVTVSGSINSTASVAGMLLHFYATPSSGNVNARQGRRYLGSTTINTDASGNQTFSNINLSGYSGTVAAGELITATATTPGGNGSTSEFSQGLVANSSVGNSAPSTSQLIGTEQGGLTINTSGYSSWLEATDGGALLGGRTQLSFEAQFRGQPMAGDAFYAIASYTTPTDGDQFFLGAGKSGASEFLYLMINNQLVTINTDVDAIFDGNQRSLAFTWNQTAGAYTIYLDGVVLGSGTGLATGHTFLSGGQFGLGVDLDSGADTWQPGALFQGTFKDVRIFSDVRTAAEIAASFRGELRLNEGNLIANWRFEDLSTEGRTTNTVSNNALQVRSLTNSWSTSDTPGLQLRMDENSTTGSVVGQVLGIDVEREQRISSLLSADSSLRYSAETGKFYKLINSTSTWNTALSNATATTLGGIAGELFTVGSATENALGLSFAQSMGDDIWLGFSDTVVEGVWRWYSGSNATSQGWQGTGTGHAVNGSYVNWASGQPNDTGGVEDFAFLQLADGLWNDHDSVSIQRSVVQWNADDVLDATNAVTYSLTTQTVAGAFSINSDTGVITVANGGLLNFESQTSHTLTVRTTDGSGSTFDKNYMIALNNLTEENNAPSDLSSGINLNTDGGNNAYLMTSSGGSVFGGRTALTLEVIYTMSSSASNENPLISYAVAGADNEVYLRVTPSGSLSFAVNNVAAVSTAAFAQLVDGQQHAVAVSWDNTAGDVRFYIDGQLVHTATGVKVGTTIQSGGSLVMGQDQDSVNGGFNATQRFSGTLYDVRVWDRAISDEQIALNYQQVPGATETGLIANWRMSGLSGGNTVVDSVSGVNLTVANVAVGGGFTASTPTAGLSIAENASVGTRVGQVLATDADLSRDIVADGLFREAASPGSFATYTTGQSIGNWTVQSGDVDLIGTLWQTSPLGGRSIDLNGNNPGVISQTLSTVAGRQYQVLFNATGNWTSGDVTKDFRVNAAGISQDFSLTQPTGWSSTNMLFSGRSMAFTASGSSSTLTFQGLDSGGSGAVIADVRVIEIPAAVSAILSNDTTLSYDAGTGKFYRAVNSNVNWTNALTAATGASLNGVTGELVTIGSRYENDLVWSLARSINKDVWLGASDVGTEGTWRWYSGSSPSTTFWVGAAAGTLQSGQYANWRTSEPNDSGGNEDYGHMYVVDGTWNDRIPTVTMGYVVEWDASEVLSNYTYTITSDPSGVFTINSSTGEITVGNASPLNEIATDPTITVQIADASGNTYSEVLTIAVARVNDNTPTITSNGGGATAAINVAENATAVTTIAATDADLPAQTLTYSIVGGADSSLFSISSSTGALSFITGRNFESPADVGANNIYDVTIRVDDGTFWDDQAIAVTITNVNEAPVDAYAVPAVTNSNILGYYSFTSANNLGRDDAGDNQTMTLFGSPSQTTRPGGSGAIDLSGGQYGSIGSMTTGGAMTIASWVKFDTTSVNGFERFIDLGQSNSGGIGNIYIARLGTSNDLTFTIEKNGVYTHRATLTNGITNGTWMHVAATVDASGNMTLYVNGTAAATATGVAPDVGVRTNHYVGKSNWAADGAFDGAIDDLIIANGAMSATSIAALYQQSNGFTISEAASNGSLVGTVLAADPDAANTYTFTLPNSAGGAFAINSSTGQITVANSSLLNFEGSPTMSVTVRVTDQGGLAYDEVIAVNLTNVDEASTIAIPTTITATEDTNIVFSSANGNAITVGDPDGSNQRVTISVPNGSLSLFQTTGLTFTAGDGAADSLMTFSGSIANINAALNGLIYTPVANYNGSASIRVVSGDAAQATALDTDVNLLVRYSFDNSSQLNDDTATTANGTTSGAVTASENTRGNVASFDGVDDVITTANFTTPSNFTVGVWAKSDTATWNNTGFLLSKRDSFVLHPWSGGTLIDMYVQNSSGVWYNASFNLSTISGFSLTDWHYYAGSFDGTTIRLYIDGVERAAAAFTGTLMADSGPMTIGQDDGIGGRFFDGNLDDARVYSRALSGAEMATLAANSSAVREQTFSITAVNDTPTFSIGDGIVTTAIGSGNDYGTSIAMQADGKILVAGFSHNGSNNDFALARYNTDGTLDTSFSGDGKLTTAIGAGADAGNSVTVQADGKILVAGSSHNGSNLDFALVRYNSDGTLDTTFSGDGMLTTAIGGGADTGYSVTVQTDGKILVGGQTGNNFSMARYNSDGTLDTSFSGDGILTTDISSGTDTGYSVTVQSDGKIILAGEGYVGSNYDFALVRYNSDGTLDTSFSGDGKVTTDVGADWDWAYGVTVQSDGKILASGSSYNTTLGNYEMTLIRYNSDGSLDTSFGGADGIATANFGDSGFYWSGSIALQSDGKILVSSHGMSEGNDVFAVARFNSNGTLDTSFSGDGMLTTDIGSGSDRAYRLVVQSDGKIVLAGSSYNGSNDDFALVRYNSDGTLDTGFDSTTPNTLGGTVTFTEGGSAVVLDSNVQIIDAELTAANNFSGATLTLVRNGGASSQDVFSATGTLSTLTQGGNLVVSSTTVGTVTTNSAGTLVLTFNSSATNSLVNSVMQQIAYSNSSDAPPASAQINWTFNDGNTGSQGSGGALTGTGSVVVNITAVNDAPTITNLSGDSVSYLEGAGAVVIEQGGNALVGDVDSTNFDTGTLTVSFVAGSDSAEDVLGIRNEGNGAGQIGVSGFNVTYSGVVIGTWTGGSGGANLVVTLNANANATSTAALVNNLTYLNTDNATPTTSTRNIQVVLTDGDGGTSASNVTTMTVTSVNDAPTAVTDTANAVEAGGTANGTAGTNPTGNVLANDTDVDVADTKTVIGVSAGVQVSAAGAVSSAVTGSFGSITIAADGSYTYSVDNNNATVQALRTTANTLTDVFTYTMRDAAGLTSTTQVTVTIQGSSDAPSDVVATRYLSTLTPTATNNTYSGVLNDIDHVSNPLVIDGVTYARGLGIHAPTSGVATADYAINGATTFKSTIGINDFTTGTFGSVIFRVYVDNVLQYTSPVVSSISSPIDLAINTTGGTTLRLEVDNAGNGFSADHAVWLNARFEGSSIGLAAAENSTNGTVVGSVNRIDSDWGDNATYILTDNAAGRFAIANGTGLITVANSSLLDYEAATSWAITVQATDAAGLSYSKVMTVTLTDVNEAPTSIVTGGGNNLLTNGSFESTLSGWTASGTVGTTSLPSRASDGTGSAAFNNGTAVTGGQLSQSFATQVGQTYVVTFDMGGHSFGANIGTTHNLLVEAISGGTTVLSQTASDTTSQVFSNGDGYRTFTYSFVATGTTTELRFTDNSTNVGQTDLQLDRVRVWNETLSVAENSTNSTAIGTAAGLDPDGILGLSYSLTDNAGGRFAIDNLTGAISVANGSLLNFESAISHNVTIQVTDANGLSTSRVVAVNVTNVNEGPVAVFDIETAVEAGGTANGTAGTNPTGNVLTNDTDIDSGDTKTISGVVAGTSASASGSVGVAVTGTFGTINIAADGSYTYTVDNSNVTVQALRTSGQSVTDVFTYTMTDAGGLTSTTQVTVNITGANDAPSQSSIEGSVLTYVENAAATSITSTLTISDVDDANISSAIVQITGNYANGQDILSFIDQNGIAGIWDSSSGTLTLSGSATKSQYETALRSITYSNSSEAPSTSTRTVSFTINDSSLNSNTLTRDIAITSVNDAPINTLPGTQVTAVSTPLVLSGALAIQVSDVDAGSSSIRMTLTASHGTISLASTSGLTFTTGDGTVDGVVVFSGTAANINAALDGLSFAPTGGYSGTASITLLTEDLGNTGTGGAKSDTDVLTIQVGAMQFQEGVNGYTGTQDTHINSASSNTSYGSNVSVEVDDPSHQALIRFDNLFGSGPGQIAYGSTITNASLSFYVTGTDSLDDVNVHRMLANWSESSTWNSLTGGISANGTEASATILYTIDAGIGGWVTVTGITSTVQAWSDGATNYGWALLGSSADNYAFRSSEFATASFRPYLSISFTAPQSAALDLDANNSSGATGGNFSTSFTENGGSVLVADSDASLTDADSTHLISMTATITNLLDGTAESLSAVTTGTSITASYDSGTGVLTLSGSDTVANYQQVLRTIRYNNTSEDPNTTARQIQFVGQDAYVASLVVTATVSINAVNDVPTIFNLAGDSRSYNEGSGAVIIDQSTGASIADVDSANFASGSLTVSFTAGSDTSEDVLSIQNQGVSAGLIGISGSNVTYGGSLIGTYTGGASGSSLVLTLNANATSTAATALLRAIMYTNVDNDDPLASTRTISFTFNDGDGGTSAASTAQIIVTPINDEQVLTTNTGATVDEGSTGNAIIAAQLQTTDVDNTSTQLVYTITAAPSNGTLYRNGIALTLSSTFTQQDIASGLITYNHNGSETTADAVSFTVDDGAGSFSSGTFNWIITPVNDNPVAVIDTATAIEAGGISNGTAGTNPAGNVLTNDTDVDASDTKTVIGVSAGVQASAAGAVSSAVAGSFGSITIAADGSYTYSVDNNNATVQALRTTANTLTDVFTYTMRDAAGLTSTTQITVTIQGANDAPSDITGTLTIAENSANLANVGTVSRVDVDSGDGATYALTNDAGGRFTINSSTGQITVANGSLLDFEANTSHTIVVQVTDTAFATFSKTMTVNVTNVNEAPVDVRTGTQNISITNSSFESDVLPDGQFTTSLTSWTTTNSGGAINPTTGHFGSGNGTDGANVGWVNTGSLSQILSTNFNSNLNYQLTVDVGRRLDVAARNYSIQLLAGATVLGTYTSVTGDAGNWSTINLDISGASFAAANGQALQIVLSGTGAQTSFDNVRLTSTSSTLSIAEHSTNGTVVGTITGADRDAANTLSYSLQNDAGGRFTINSTTGQITVFDGSLLDFETNATHNVVVRASDQGGLAFDRTVTINLTNVNEAPTAVSDSVTAVEAGGVSNGTAGTNPSGNVLTNDTDVDVGDTKSVVGVAAGAIGNASGSVGGAVTGSFGSITIASDGTYTYTVNNSNATVQALAVGQSITDVFTYTMTDTGGLSFSTQITVTIQGANDEQVLATNAGTTVAENSTGTILSNAMLETTDVDHAASQVVYTITSAVSNGTLRRNGVALTLNSTFTQADINTGLVTYDHNGTETSSDSFQFSVDDGLGTTSTGTFNLTITPVNDQNPIITSNGGGASVNLNIAENSTSITTVTATDGDLPSQTLAYSISGADAALFSIDSQTGVLTFVSGRNRESHSDADTNGIYEVIVQVSDGTLVDTQSISVTITDIDEFDTTATVDSNAAANSVAENAANGTTAGIVASASDGDATTNTITYSLDNNASGRFTIDANTGVVSVLDGTLLNYENATSHVITVRSTSADSSFTTANFTINLTDVNESAISAISDSDAAADTVLENATIGAVVGVTAFASDPDGTDTVTYSLDDSAGGRFTVDANTGVVTVAGAIDREAAASYNITIRATSSDTSTSISTRTIAIEDVDEFNVAAVTDSNGAANSVIENATIGTTVGIVASANDADATTYAITYTLSDNDGGRFTIDAGTGVVTVAGGIDRELDGSTRTITVRATSADASYSEEIFSINIVDANEFNVTAPTDVNAAANAIDENVTIGTVVGVQALAADADATTNTITYSLFDNDGGNFSIDANTGVVTTAAAINRESLGASRNITVRATSTDGSTADTVFTININDLDEFDVGAVTDGNNGNNEINEINENAANGAIVGVQALAADADATTNTITYSLDDNAGGRFAIDSSTGVVTVLDGSLLDYESATSHGIVVRATSADTSFSIQNYTINLTDVNEGVISAISDTDGAADTVLENATIGTVVGITASATDPDGTDTVSYSLDDDAGGRFTIHATTGVVTVAGAIDREAAASYNITIRATSSDTSFSTSTRTISIGDVDEFNVGAVTDSDAAVNSVVENATVGTVVGVTGLAADADSTTNAITYTLTDNDGGRFAIDAGTGVVTVAGGIDRESHGSTRLITVRATSADSSYSEEIFSISIVDANESSVSAISDSNNAANTVAENAINGTVVGIQALATDADATTNTITYSLDDNAGGRFAIDSSTGVVTVADGSLLDYETATSHGIVVRATSADASFSTQSYTINLTDVNEGSVSAVSDSNASVNYVLENSSIGAVVGLTALADDPDGTDTVTYSLDDDAGGRFAIDATTGVVTVSGAIDREAAASYSITIRATSSDSSTSTFTSTISIGDVDEYDVGIISDLNAATDTLAENSPTGTVVGITANAMDVDATSNSVSYSLTNNAGGRFGIDSVTGLVTVADGSLLNFELSSSHVISVRATSIDGSYSLRDFTINLSDVNEKPYGVGDSYSVTYIDTLATSAANGLTANDGDPDGDLLTAYLISGPSNGSFVLRADGGFTYVPTAGFTGTVTFVYGVTDGVLQSDSITVSIEVTIPLGIPGGGSGGGSSSSGSGSGSSSSSGSTSSSTSSSTDSDTASDTNVPQATGKILGDQTALSSSGAANSETGTGTVSSIVAGPYVEMAQGESRDGGDSSVTAKINSSITRGIITRNSSGSSESSFQNLGETFGRRGMEREDANGIRELSTAGNRIETDDSKRSFFTTDSVVNTVLGTGMVIWIIQGAQILAAVLSTAPAMIQLDPLSVLPSLQRDEEETEGDIAGKLFDERKV